MRSKTKESYPLERNSYSKSKTLIDSYQNDLMKDETHEQFSGRFASETLIKKTTQIQNERVLFQLKNYANWAADDNKRIGLIVNKDFTMKFENNISAKNFEIFEINSISLNREFNSVVFKAPEKEKWLPLSEMWNGSFNNESAGIKLQNLVLKMAKSLNLRSLGFRTYMNFTLKGDGSTMGILLRCNEKINNEEAILIQFIKEGNNFNQRLFLTLGKLNENLKEFVYLKKCEIPIFDPKDEFSKNDIIEIKATIVDYGDDKLKINVELVENTKKPFKLKYSEMFIPYFDSFNLYVMGTGENAVLKKIVCEFFDRKEWDNENSGFFSIGKCHCNIF